MKRVYELDVYKLAEELSDMVWHDFDKWNKKVQYTVGYQTIRSSDSIAANIAEGYGRYTPAEQYKGMKTKFLFSNFREQAPIFNSIARSYAMYQVMTHPATYDTTRAAVDRAFDLFPQDLENKKVLIKPNVLRASDAAEGIVTHPAVLAAVVDKVETLGPASLIVGDNPGLFSYGANEAAFKQTGLMAAAKGYYRNIGLDAVSVPFNPDFRETVSVSRAIVEADIVISLPKFKTHGLTVMTGAIKNSYGFLPGAQKARLHKIAGNPSRFHDLVVEVFKLRVPDLFIVDAVVGMEGNGPASPELREIGLILASDNAVALDAVMATMMGLVPGRLRFLQNAADAGLGTWNMDEIRIDGNMVPLENFKLPPLGGEAIQDNAAVQEMLGSKTQLMPQADTDGCTACCTCVEQCPAQALSMVDDLPQVDMASCVTCFCCQEICPEKAMTLQ